jgi:hypothetical protein
LSTDSTISRLRRDLALGALLQGTLFAAALASLVVLPLLLPQVNSSVALLAVFIIWVALMYNSAKGSRLSADAPGLIAAGQFEEAEGQIEQTLKAFSMFRGIKLQAAHQLAVLRHAQRRFRESAALSQAVLAQRGAAATPMSRSVRLLLADTMLEIGDLRGAYDALSGIYGQRLSLSEVLNLLLSQLDYESRIGAWSRMMHDAMTKVQLAELMPPPAAARTQALLALSAKNIGRADFCDWLRSRVELLVDPPTLVAQRPLLADLWPAAPKPISGLDTEPATAQ